MVTTKCRDYGGLRSSYFERWEFQERLVDVEATAAKRAHVIEQGMPDEISEPPRVCRGLRLRATVLRASALQGRGQLHASTP